MDAAVAGPNSRLLFVGLCSALGGVFISLGNIHTFTEGMTSGAGYLAVTAVIFGNWRVWRMFGACLLFGAATALRLAYEDLPQTLPRIIALRDRLITGLLHVPGSQLTGHPTERLPNNASFCFEGVEGESILLNLNLLGIAASTGSACTSGSVDPSHVLLAMGLPIELAHGSLRLTLGKNNTDEDVDTILSAVPGIVAKLRGLRD